MATSRSAGSAFSNKLNRRLAGGQFAVFPGDRVSNRSPMVDRLSYCENRGLSPIDYY